MTVTLSGAPSNKRIKLTRSSAGGLTAGRRARSLSAMRWAEARRNVRRGRFPSQKVAGAVALAMSKVAEPER